jgi:hypothetical protein
MARLLLPLLAPSPIEEGARALETGARLINRSLEEHLDADAGVVGKPEIDKEAVASVKREAKEASEEVLDVVKSTERELEADPDKPIEALAKPRKTLDKVLRRHRRETRLPVEVPLPAEARKGLSKIPLLDPE